MSAIRRAMGSSSAISFRRLPTKVDASQNIIQIISLNWLQKKYVMWKFNGDEALNPVTFVLRDYLTYKRGPSINVSIKSEWGTGVRRNR